MTSLQKAFLPVVALAIAVLITGCGTYTSESGSPIEPSKVAQIKKGSSTRADVVALLGEPVGSAGMPGGKSVMSYSYTKTDAEANTATAYIPVVSLFSHPLDSTAHIRMETLQITIDAQGIVEDYSFADNTTTSTTQQSGFLGASTKTTTNTAPTQTQTPQS